MAEFFGHMKETSSQRVEINDIGAVVFKPLLDFIYTDSVEDFDLL
jgi:speckle-type POZ protein